MRVANKYQIQKQIGIGSFGTLFQGVNLRTGEKVAIKKESLQTPYKLLKNESRILHWLSRVPGVPEMKGFHVDADHQYLVMTLLGEPILKTNPAALFIQNSLPLFGILEVIHDKGIVHRDIKPEHFLASSHDPSQWVLVDFGFATFYVEEIGGKHKEPTRISQLIGSPNYASLGVHERWEPLRRDDVESLIYTLMFLHGENELPWIHETDEPRIYDKKRDARTNPSVPAAFRSMLFYVDGLAVKERPNYGFLTACLKILN